MRPILLSAIVALQMTGAASAQDTAGVESSVAASERLAAVLRTGRSVVSANQGLINDPDIGDKGLSPEAFLDELNQRYQSQNGEPVLAPALDERERRLLEAQLEAMRVVIEENQEVINAEGVAFKGFIPAVFARLTNENFAAAMGPDAAVKVTAPIDLVRNRKARPDDWETMVLEEKFRSEDWETGRPFYEVVEEGGTKVFRMLIPEYYSESCLSCHGAPAGEVDVTGFPKEGGEVGELAGAISVTLR